MPRSILGAVALTLLVAGCDSAGGATPTCAPPATPTAPTVSVARLSATASAGGVAPGEAIQFTVTAQGPLSLNTDCTAPLEIAIVDANGVSVDTSAATTAAPAPHCGQVSLSAGQTLTYRAAWTPDPTLPSGTYTVTLILGDQPPLELPLPVRTFHGGC